MTARGSAQGAEFQQSSWVKSHLSTAQNTSRAGQGRREAKGTPRRGRKACAKALRQEGACDQRAVGDESGHSGQPHPRPGLTGCPESRSFSRGQWESLQFTRPSAGPARWGSGGTPFLRGPPSAGNLLRVPLLSLFRCILPVPQRAPSCLRESQPAMAPALGFSSPSRSAVPPSRPRCLCLWTLAVSFLI